MDKITVEAYGKINLGLDVTGRRDDGYHLVKMIMQTVALSDYVSVSRGSADAERSDARSDAEKIMEDVVPCAARGSADSGKKDITAARDSSSGAVIEVSCTEKSVPAGKENIAWKAAWALAKRFGIRDRISIHIEKRIPVSAGMAGGSADAAAVILAMNELCGLGMSKEVMEEIASGLGADVPFCLTRGTYLAEGTGTVLTKLKDAPCASVLIVNPPYAVSTAHVYKELDKILSAGSPRRPDIDALRAAAEGGSVSEMSARMGNILESVTEKEFPLIRDIKEEMLRRGAAGSMMTGSGPTVFGLFEEKTDAEKALEFFEKHRKEYGRVFLTDFVKCGG